MTRTRHDERPESALLVAARQLAEEAHHHRRLPDRRGMPARRRPHVPSAPGGHGSGTDATGGGS